MLDLLDPDRRGAAADQRRSAPRRWRSAIERDAADPAAPVLVERCAWLDRDAALALADPGQDFDRGADRPARRRSRCDMPSEASAALTLARLAGLLPALWLLDAGEAASRGRRRRRRCAGAPPRRQSWRARGCRSTTCRRDADRRLPRSGERRGACRAGDRRLRRQAAAGPAAQRMPDRRRVRQPRNAIAGRSSSEALRIIGRRAAGCCSICARKGAASAWPTSCAPMRCRTAGSTRSTPTAGSASPTTSATMAWPRRCCARSGIDRVRLLTNNPAKVAGLEADGIAVRRAGRAPHAGQPAQRRLSRDQAQPQRAPGLGFAGDLLELALGRLARPTSRHRARRVRSSSSWRAALGDPALVEHDDLVGVDHRSTGGGR